MGRTLWVHFAFSFLKVILAIYVLCFMLIAVIDYLELLRQAFGRERMTALQAALISLLRVPSIAEAVLPFATLFGSIAALAIANRRLELVVARAAGVSAWQFLLPGAVVGLAIGVAASAFYSPIASAMMQQSVKIAASVAGLTSKPATARSGKTWFFQNTPDGSSIISASQTSDLGMSLAGVSAFIFNVDGTFRERVDAPRAELVGRAWRMTPAVVTKSGSDPHPTESYDLANALSESQIRDALADPNTVSFWQLPRLIQLAEESSLPAERFRLKFQRLLAQPFLLLAMVLIAGVVSLRFNRQNRVGGMILAGIAAGFVLYVINEITRDLGASGLVSPAIAAWLPAVLSTLISMSFLLRQEDG